MLDSALYALHSHAVSAVNQQISYDYTAESPEESRGVIEGISCWRIEDALVQSDKFVVWVFPDREIRYLIVNPIMQIEEVSFIYAKINPDESVVWTLLKTYDRSARERVYAKELEVRDMLSVYGFDFRATSVELVSPTELSESGFEQIFSRA